MEYEFRLPDVGEGVAEAEIVRWLVDEGEVIDQDQPVVEVQTDKAVVELPSPVKGQLRSRGWPEGSNVPVGEILFVVAQAALEVRECIKVSMGKKRALATPSVRRLAKEMGIDLQTIAGTGKEGRVLEGDLQKRDSTPPGSIQETFSTPDVSARVADPAPARKVDELSLSSIRRVIGERLLYSITHKPHATHFDQLDVEGLVMWRSRIKQEDNTHITYTASLLKLVAYTLKQHPLFNAHFHEDTQKIHQLQSVSVGIATDTSRGLLVPVIHEVEKKNMIQLDAEIRQLTELARAGKCSPEQLKGSTFTISNAGTLGGTWATPIINPPEVAILALHPIEQRPVIQEGKVVAGWRMNVSLSFDHRIVDGADAIRFTRTLARYTGDPARLLHEVI